MSSGESDSIAVIYTERLFLRTYEPADAGRVLAYYGNAEVCRYLLHDPWTIDDAIAAVDKRTKRTGLDSGAIALVVEHEGRVIGNVSAWFTDDPSPQIDVPASVELGWTFSPNASGRGYATEAVRALIDLVFESPAVHRVSAQMDGRNDASARLATRMGMRREAHLRKNWWSKGEWTDTFIYALLREDWHLDGNSEKHR